MIVRGRPSLRGVIFTLRGSILLQIRLPLLFMTCISAAAVLLARARPEFTAGLSAIPFTLIGLSLSIFMSFRNTACYDRWWEGRKLWGQLVIASRSFARQVAALEPTQRDPLLKGLCAFAAGLCARLRGRDEATAIARHLGPGDWSRAPNPTDAVLMEIGRQCRMLVASGATDPMHYTVLEAQLSEIAHVQGGCERIKHTPLPFSYSLLLHRTAYAFCLLLPFALAQSLGWWTLLPTFLVSYAFFGLDALGDELGDPFGVEANDLPLDALVRGIERELLHAMGVAELPPPLEAKGHVLL